MASPSRWQGVNRALGQQHEAVIALQGMGEPQPLACPGSEACIALIFDFVTAQALLIEMGEHGIAPAVDADPPCKT